MSAGVLKTGNRDDAADMLLFLTSNCYVMLKNWAETITEPYPRQQVDTQSQGSRAGA